MMEANTITKKKKDLPSGPSCCGNRTPWIRFIFGGLGEFFLLFSALAWLQLPHPWYLQIATGGGVFLGSAVLIYFILPAKNRQTEKETPSRPSINPKSHAADVLRQMIKDHPNNR